MIPLSNITFEKLITASASDSLATDYIDAQGFFFRAAVAGNIKYDPVDNPDGDSITKPIAISDIFIDPVRAKKIYASGTTAQGIYIGKGV